MAAYVGYTMRMTTMFHGWPIMVNDMHTKIETGAIWKLGCRFLFAFHSNYDTILYRLQDIATYWSKIPQFLYPICI